MPAGLPPLPAATLDVAGAFVGVALPLLVVVVGLSGFRRKNEIMLIKSLD